MLAIIGLKGWFLIFLVASMFVLLPLALIAVIVWLVVRKRKPTA
jgi:hypothetical protein